MSEKPIQPPFDPGDLSDETKKELLGIEFETVLRDLESERASVMNKEMQRHGFDSSAEDKETSAQKTRLMFSYLAAESEALLAYVDYLTANVDYDEMAILQELGLLGEEIVDVRLDFDGRPGFVVEQVIINEGENVEQIRWTGYHLRDGKLHVVSINIPIDELGNSDIEHQAYIHQRLGELQSEVDLGVNDTECSISLAQKVTKFTKELRGVLHDFYISVESNEDDIANW